MIFRVRKTPALIACLLIFLLPVLVHADVFDPLAPGEEKYLLNGDWKYTEVDGKDYQAPEYDDSAWKTVKVPGYIERTNGRGLRVMWFRKTFTPPDNTIYEWLRLEQVLDEAEVWLNGEKLANPMYQAPLEDRQPGVFQSVWDFHWPHAFPAGNLVRPGERNTIAVRVTDDPVAATALVSSHDGPAFRGRTGIAGAVFLIPRPQVFIRSIERLAPEKLLSGGQVEHKFFAVVDNTTARNSDCGVSITVRNRSGTEVFRKSISKTIPPGGAIAEFGWKAVPSFQQLTAEISVTDSRGDRDSALLSFHGAVILQQGDSLLVNGEGFRVRGIEGMPGLETNPKTGASVLKRAQAGEELRQLAGMGINTLRMTDPAPPVMQEALAAGIMVVPVIERDWLKTVIALREHPNILYWDIVARTERDLYVTAEAISTLDTYKRPIAWSGKLKTKSAAAGERNIRIRGIESFGMGAAACSDGNPEMRPGMPYVLVRWGEPSNAAGDPRGILETEPALRKSWESCVENGGALGVIYAQLARTSGRVPAVKNQNTNEWNPVAGEVFSNLFGNLSLGLISAGPNRVYIEIRPASPSYSIHNLSVTDGNNTQLAGAQKLEKEQSLTVPLKDARAREPLLIRYYTHGGIRHELSFDPSVPVFSPDRLSAVPPAIRVKRGGMGKARITIRGGETAGKAEVEPRPGPGIEADPKSRGVYVPAVDDVSAIFSFRASENADKNNLVPIEVRSTDEPGLPMKTYISIIVE